MKFSGMANSDVSGGWEVGSGLQLTVKIKFQVQLEQNKMERNKKTELLFSPSLANTVYPH